MTIQDIFLTTGGIGMVIISFFLREAYKSLRDVIKDSIELSRKVAVIESENLLKDKHIEEKFDTLQVAIKDLTVSIKDLNNELKKAKLREILGTKAIFD